MQLCAAFVSQLQNSYNHIDVMFIEFLLGHLISQLFACDPTTVFAKKAVEILVPPPQVAIFLLDFRLSESFKRKIWQ